MPRLVFAVTLFLALASAFTGGVWWFAYSSALDQLADRGRADLTLASDRLVSQLQQYRELAVLMADHPTVAALLSGETTPEAARALLVRSADKTGTLEIYVSGPTGDVIAKSGALEADETRAIMPSFRRAMQGALGAHHERTNDLVDRAYIFAAPVYGDQPGPIGVVSVEVNIWAVESVWVGEPQAVFFTDRANVVFISNRTELLFAARGDASASELAQFGYVETDLPAFPSFTSRDHAGHEVWSINGGRYLPQRALHLTKPLPIIGMTGELLLDIAPALRIAGLQAAVAAALSLMFGATLLLLSQRRRALSDRLALEAAAKAELETRVAARTAELSDANRNLMREVTERKEAEAALKRAQQELVQAGKLSALGKMSAGLSHELNQPLMAIRSFAENAEQFLARDEPDRASRNLAHISELARRMGRIIRNLRAFARQESEPMADVDLAAVVEAVIEMAETRMRNEGVTLDWISPPAPVMVRGGEVRLQQVVLNLVSNALDAMAGRDDARLELALDRQGGKVRLSVRDHGPGIEDPEKIFDPFYTTKEVGASEGMGLGLSISYGLVQSFGGAIRGRNHIEGGAVFTVELTAAGLEDAA